MAGTRRGGGKRGCAEASLIEVGCSCIDSLESMRVEKVTESRY
jgi:hypothetical protein